MTKISPTQQRILKAACKQPKTDIREHMQDIKSPAIRDKVVESMLKHSLIMEDPEGDGIVYVIADAGYAAIGKSKPKAENKAKTIEPESEVPPAKKSKDNQKRAGSKQQTMIDLLSRKQGATIKQLQEATGWQKHSLHGAMANMKKKLSIAIESTKDTGGERVYRIA
jgi:hypothetical protein